MDDSSTLGRVRALLARMMATVASDAIGDAGVIVDGLRGVSGPITMLRLDITPGAPKLPVADGPMTGFYVLDDRGQLTGELLLWIVDGEPSTLEYAWYTEEPPAALPEPRRVVIKEAGHGVPVDE